MDYSILRFCRFEILQAKPLELAKSLSRILILDSHIFVVFIILAIFDNVELKEKKFDLYAGTDLMHVLLYVNDACRLK